MMKTEKRRQKEVPVDIVASVKRALLEEVSSRKEEIALIKSYHNVADMWMQMRNRQIECLLETVTVQRKESELVSVDIVQDLKQDRRKLRVLKKKVKNKGLNAPLLDLDSSTSTDEEKEDSSSENDVDGDTNDHVSPDDVGASCEMNKDDNTPSAELISNRAVVIPFEEECHLCDNPQPHAFQTIPPEIQFSIPNSFVIPTRLGEPAVIHHVADNSASNTGFVQNFVIPGTGESGGVQISTEHYDERVQESQEQHPELCTAIDLEGMGISLSDLMQVVQVAQSISHNGSNNEALDGPRQIIFVTDPTLNAAVEDAEQGAPHPMQFRIELHYPINNDEATDLVD